VSKKGRVPSKNNERQISDARAFPQAYHGAFEIIRVVAAPARASVSAPLMSQVVYDIGADGAGQMTLFEIMVLGPSN
jgi:hypothetical protein